jgi:hypothetical protein
MLPQQVPDVGLFQPLANSPWKRHPPFVIPRVCDFISFAKKPLLKTNSLDTSKIAKNQ